MSLFKLSGVLTIRAINGSRGMFNVGRLMTPIGDFAVKSPAIEEYEPGKYEGEFGVSRIYPSHYFAHGRLVVEVRADVASIALASIADLPKEDQVPIEEQDPASEKLTSPAPAAIQVDSQLQAVDAEVAADARAPSGEVASASPAAKSFEELFGDLWPLQDRVKLDPTVDRMRFRAQRDVLKDMGYRFQPLGQVWEKA